MVGKETLGRGHFQVFSKILRNYRQVSFNVSNAKMNCCIILPSLPFSGAPEMPQINPDDDPDLVWIPYGLKVILGPDGKVDIEELPEEVRGDHTNVDSGKGR